MSEEELMYAEPAQTSLKELFPSLKETDQWVCWKTKKRDDKQTKVPIDPETNTFASIDDPDTWASFEVANNTAQSAGHIDGIGFVFTADDEFCGIDLDDIRNPKTGKLDDIAQTIVPEIDSYTEISPSGTGLHIIVRGSLPAGRRRHNNIEMYDSNRFFTITGEHVQDTPQVVNYNQASLESIHTEYVSRQPDHKSLQTNTDVSTQNFDIKDEEIIQMAKTADNGDLFQELWAGKTSRYKSHSEADMALCTLLAFWTGNDHAQIDRLFRKSGLMRQKWDAKRGDKTYGELTIDKAIRLNNETYTPRKKEEATPAPEPTLGAPVRQIAELSVESITTVEATVNAVTINPHESIHQTGLCSDSTDSIRFVYWDTDSSQVYLQVGETYRFRNCWVDVYDNERTLYLSERTNIEFH
ncbi:MAG: hypothetical protein ABEI06_09810 [Halobacteriaceae archaeon]